MSAHDALARCASVALMMTNRPEFYPIGVAVQHLGATPFSLYNTSAPDQINYYVTDSGAKVVIAEQQFIDKVLTAKEGTKVELVVCIDADIAGASTLDELSAFADGSFDFEKSWRAVQPDDVLTLIYTSGTTGDPKGVQITHANQLSILDSTQRLWDSSSEDRLVSFLPSAHIADRWSALYHLMVVGNQVTTVADRTQFAAALTDVRPTVLGAVPQVWQKLKAGIDAKLGEATGVKALLAGWAVDVGRQVSDATLDGKSVNPLLAVQHVVADALVLSKIRVAIGVDQAKLALSGAAPISPDVLRFFNGFGIPVSDAWGMSELSAMLTMSPPGKVRPGTVGAPLDGAEIRIAEDGEVLVRGPMVMKGYLNKPEKPRKQSIPMAGCTPATSVNSSTAI